MPPKKNLPPEEDAGPADAPQKESTAASKAQIEDEVRQAAAEYFERLTEAASTLTDQARHVYSLSHDYVKEHPTGLIAGAFGLGIVLGMLLDRD